MADVRKYDYIIAGAGAAGLSLLTSLMQYPNFNQKSVLVIDKEKKTKNDRTWCFWQKETGPFESILTASWKHLYFHSNTFSKLLDIHPYKYKMIRGIDFYNYCFKKIRNCANIDFVQTEISTIKENGEVICLEQKFQATYVFNSAKIDIPQLKNKHFLLQHFKGWVIETEVDQFDPEKPVLMDFRIPQDQGCTFMYVLPLTHKKAIIEYTLFSPTLLDQGEYDRAIKVYIHDCLKVMNYSVVEEEFGVIPMTNNPIQGRTGEKIINIGTAGGYTKASTGYTFTFIQDYCRKIAENLMSGKTPDHGLITTKTKYKFYDSVFLRVLKEQKHPAWKVFTDMFSKLPSPLILDFLNEQSDFLGDFRVMNSVDKLTFTKAVLKEMF